MDLTLLNVGDGVKGKSKPGPGERSDDEDSYGSVEGAGFDTRRSLTPDDSDEDDCYNDEGLNLPIEEGDLTANLSFDHHADDKYLQQIKDSIAKHNGETRSVGSAGSGSNVESPQIKTSDQYVSIPHGLIPRASYEHGKRSTNIMGVTYNARMRQFIIIDSKGVTAWKRDAVDHRVTRALSYPKYEYGLITNMLYAKKYNCYFVLGKDFSLKVYNRDFFETCSVSADLRSVLFMLFNPVRDELITGGVGGTKVWRFHQQSGNSYTELKPLANYGLSLKYELPNVGGSWVKRVELDYHLEHLYCCSDTDLHVYDLGGKLLFKFERAHMMSITGCRYSRNASVLVTSSIDCEVKVWSLMGGLVHTFRGHSRAVTNLILHPCTSSIVITCSLDGSVRMWSLDTMDTLYSMVVSADGVMWMGLTDDNLLFLSTQRAITLWNLNYSLQFWAMARSRVNKMSLVGCKGKTTRLMALLDDNSVRLMARSNNKNLCTVLPPPSISPLQRVLSVCYSREFNVIFMLTNPHEIWVYTTRTDPSCRIAVWDVVGMQAMISTSGSGKGNQENFDSTSIAVNKPAPSHRATENGAGNEVPANCCCVSILNSTAILWTDEGPCCPIRDSYLLMGLEDGRILFMDPVIKGHKYLEFKTGKDPVLDMTHDMEHGSLTTVHKLKDMMQILVWSLPDLELQHEVYAAMDLRAYARVGYTLVTGHESGCIIFNPLEITNDQGLNKGRTFPLYADVIDVHHKPEHLAPVIGVDVCPHQKIFCSCSNDGAIKIWNEDGALMTEIMLDPSLTSVCFLNNLGDLLVGFQKQIFYIDHSKVCPQVTVPESDVDGFEKESFICEDPAVLYEGVTPNPDPITLESYLVPFDIEFSKDFLEGRVKLEPEPVKEEESDDESEASMAPTDTYLSPVSTPRSDLSHIDLTLGSDISKYDLLKQMKKTLDHLREKERLEAEEMVHQAALDSVHRSAQARRRRKMMKQGLLQVEDFEDGVITSVEETNVEDADGEQTKKQKGALPTVVVPPLKFDFPVFGESPGPTPESSNPATPTALSENEEDAKPETKVQVKPVEVKVQVVTKEPDEISKFLETSRTTDLSTSTKSSRPEVSSTPRKKFGLSGVSVDAASLMKEKKKVPKPPSTDSARLAAPPVAKAVETVSEKVESPRKERVTKKRMSLTSRKLPKSKKVEAVEDKMRPSSPPSSQMQALELKEQTLTVPEKKLQTHSKSNDSSNDAAKERLFDERMKIKEEDTGVQGGQRQPEKIVIKMDVPSLPTLPVEDMSTTEKHSTQTNRNELIGSATSSGFKSASGVDNKSSIDFSSLSRPGTSPALSRERTGLSTTIEGDSIDGGAGMGTGDGGLKRLDTAATGDSGIVNNIDGLSVVSGGSEEGQVAFRIGLISKEVTETDGQVHGYPAEHKVSNEAVKKVDNVPEHKKDSTATASQPATASGDPQFKKKTDAPKPAKTSGPKQTPFKAPIGSSGSRQKMPFSKDKRKLSSGKKLELSTLGSLQEVEDSLEHSPSSRGRSDKPAPTTPSARQIDSENDGTPQSVSMGAKDVKATLSKNNDVVKPDAVKTILDTLPTAPLNKEDDGDNKINNNNTFDDRQTNIVDKSSLDSSYARDTTPSLSVIETESISSSTNVGPSLRGFTSSSPIPLVSDGPPYQSSPLPTVEEVSIKSWPSSIVSEASQPFAFSTNANTLKDTTADSSNDRTMLNRVSPEAKDTSVMSSESASQFADVRRESGQITSDSLKSTTLQFPDESRGLKSSLESTMKSIDEQPASGSIDDAHSLKSTVYGKDVSVGLNKRIESESQASSHGEKPSLSTSIESHERRCFKPSIDNLEVSEALGDTIMSPVSQIIIQKKVSIESEGKSEEQVDTDGDKNDAVAYPGSNSGLEEDLESWDSDFDNMSGSGGSCMMSSPFSDSVEDGGDGSAGCDGDGSSSSGKQKIRRRALQNPGGNISASSSTTEPVLQVRIRKKPWSYYRNKEQQRSPLPPRKDMDSGQRKFSQSDAITVQRRAYLEAAKLRRQRAKSVAEGTSPSPRLQQMKSSPRVEKQGQASVTPPSSAAAYCALCAAEEGEDHGHKEQESDLKNGQRRSSHVESRKVSFEGEGASVGQGGSPRVSDIAGPLREASPRTPRPTIGSAAAEAAAALVVAPEAKTEGGQTTPAMPVETRKGEQTIPTTSAAAFEPPRPHSQAALSHAFSDISSSVQPIPSSSPIELNQSVTLTDLSHPRSQDDSDSRRPESVESGWMESDLVSVSRMGHHGAATTTGGGGEYAVGVDNVVGRAGDEVRGHDLDGDKDSDSSGKRLSRPRTCVAVDRTLGKPELDDAVKFFRQRPHTANVRFQTEDLQEAFDNTLERYKVMARPTLASDNLHRNDDIAFSENWHERQIERHMLIRMQKELRAQSAKQRRHVIEQRKQERFRQHQEQDHGPHKSKLHPHHYAHASLNPPQRCVTVHGSRPAQTTPTPTPVSSRPHTSTGLRDHQRLHPKHHHNHHTNNATTTNNNTADNANIHPATYQLAVQQLERQHRQQQHQQLISLQEQESLQRDKSELSQERAFRFRLREKEGVEQAEDPLTGEKTNLDLWAIDPRNPNALRPKSRKSIPSKCHRYVLVTKPKIKLTLPLPTPLEEELLASRFPDQGEKVYKKYEGLLYKPPKRPMYGIEYTPFQAF